MKTLTIIILLVILGVYASTVQYMRGEISQLKSRNMYLEGTVAYYEYKRNK